MNAIAEETQYMSLVKYYRVEIFGGISKNFKIVIIKFLCFINITTKCLFPMAKTQSKSLKNI